MAGGSSATSQYRTWRVVDTKALKARRAKRHGDRLVTVSDQTKSSPGRTRGGSGRPDTDTAQPVPSGGAGGGGGAGPPAARLAGPAGAKAQMLSCEPRKAPVHHSRRRPVQTGWPLRK